MEHSVLVGMEFSGTLHPKLALVNTLFREVVLTRFSEQNPYISILLLYCLCLPIWFEIHFQACLPKLWTFCAVCRGMTKVIYT